MDHLFFDHLKSVFFNSTSMLTFTILLDGIFYTHKIDASNDASTSFSLLLVFLCLLLLNCAKSDDWTLFFFCSDYRKEIFALFFFCSDFLQKETCSKRYLKIEICSCGIWTLNPHHFLPLTIFCRYWGLNPGPLPYHVFDAFTVNEHWFI